MLEKKAKTLALNDIDRECKIDLVLYNLETVWVTTEDLLGSIIFDSKYESIKIYIPFTAEPATVEAANYRYYEACNDSQPSDRGYSDHYCWYTVL